MGKRTPEFSIVLAGGRGSRMQSAERHKVCFAVDGRPAILRALDVYESCGIHRHIVVVGALAEQVMRTVSAEYPGAVFAHQVEPRGTGDAARVGLRALEALQLDADVLLVAGDRLIDPPVLQHLVALYDAEGCDLAFVAGRRASRSTQGRVLFDEGGAPLAVVELRDIQQRAALAELRGLLDAGQTPSRAQARAILTRELDERQAALAFDGLWTALQAVGPEPSAAQWEVWVPRGCTGFAFTGAAGQELAFTPAQAREAGAVNVSVYLARASALRWALDRLDRRNAQHEEYLSDIINLLAQRSEGPSRRVAALRVDDPDAVLGYNNPDELLAVEEAYRRRRAAQTPPPLTVGPGYRRVGDWLALLQPATVAGAAAEPLPEAERLAGELRAIYGDDARVLAERRAACVRMLRRAAEVLGEQTPVLLVRAPGRANILGRHVDHQGGHCNLLAIDREIVMAVRPRADDRVTLHNVAEEPFGEREFAIGQLLSLLPWDDWLALVESRQVRQLVADAQGDWSQYVRAAVLRLQTRYRDHRLCGMDLVVLGDIPIGAGLSSSSALVVATLEAALASNGLALQPAQFVDLAGEGEWFVGTRGGQADHAAVKLGARGGVTQVTFFDFGVTDTVEFPADCHLVICNSGVQAHKSAGARDTFNQRVACYSVGLQLLRARYPQYAPLLRHLRDLNVRTLGTSLSAIYAALLALPERASRAELQAMLPGEDLGHLWETHCDPADGYPVRGVVLFGLAECERSRLGAGLLRRGEVAAFGRLMNASHDGDRVRRHDAHGRATAWTSDVSDAYLRGLVEELHSEDAERVEAAQLQWQPGSYRCSTQEIDLLVDLALRAPGVLGAQLAGAGLGGCMMVLAQQAALPALRERLTAGYYAPRGLAPDIVACTPIAGSGVLLNPRHAAA